MASRALATAYRGLLIVAAIALLVGVAAWPRPAHAAASPPDRGRTCVDAPLRVHFDSTPQLGASGAITVYARDGSVFDRIDLADPNTDLKNIGGALSDSGLPHLFHYYPVIIDGNSASIYLHRQLDYGQTYSVSIDPGVFLGVPTPAGWKFSTTARRPRPGTGHLLVSASGHGDFCTVQGAIDFVPTGNRHPVIIDVAPGIYTEIIYVRPDRPFITIRGLSRGRTVVEYATNDVLNGDKALKNGGPADLCPLERIPQSDTHNCWRASFGVDAPDFTVENITLRNTTPDGGSQSEVFRANNDRITVDRVTMLSHQDTLRPQGTVFVTDSYIEGDVDFVWGSGAAFIQHSELKALDEGYYTESRNDENGYGYVFYRDRFTRGPGVADGSVLLGRTAVDRWPTAQDMVIDTAMDSHIAPVGWQITGGTCDEVPNLRFAEYHSTDLAGNPVDTSARMPCSRQLTPQQAAHWSDPRSVLSGWLPAAARH